MDASPDPLTPAAPAIVDRGNGAAPAVRGSAEMLASGKAFADLSSWRKVAVSGSDSLDWLNDLVSADLSDLAPGRARRTLLLSPTGRIRAEFTVAVPGGSLLLLQDPVQAEPIGSLLEPYVLSSDVELEDRTADMSVLAFPGTQRPPEHPGAAASAPSCLGSGLDLISLAEDRPRLMRAYGKAFRLLDEHEVAWWRIASGRSRLGVDASPEDLPVEAALDDLVSYDKGCFLGQEALAKVRNLGHPRRLVMALEGDGPVARGDAVLVDGSEAGRVTSVAESSAGRTLVLARVGWEWRSGPFATLAGVELLVRA